MKFECDKCHAQYMIADEKLGKKGVKVKCKKCQHVIIVRPGAGAPAELEVKAPKATARPESPPADLAAPTRDLAPPGVSAPASDEAADPPEAPPDDGFTQGGPTDPVARAMKEDADSDAQKAPAPISMFGDQTELAGSEQPQRAEPEAQHSAQDDKTVVAQAPDLGASSPSEEEAPRGRVDATIVSRQPEMSAEPPPAPKAPEPPAATGSELDDQIAGMFTAMFDETQGDDDQRGPTRILDASAVDALRKKAQQPSEAGAPLSLQNGPDPRALEAGLVMKGADDAPRGADDGPADAVWHAAIDDQDVGPLALAELGRHIESGRVDRDTLVWKTGMDDWLPAGDVPEVRALFDKVPPPRIGRAEEAGRAAKPSSFDMGAPIDDAPPPPGASPFDEPADDAAWRPHGLTDVYQAANLAEAAVGMGLGASGPISAPLKMSAPSSSMEPEWRPGAASALSALVQDEMKRLDQPPPPPADDGAVLPADDASINAPLFGSLATKPEIESGGDIASGGMNGGLGGGATRSRSQSAFPSASMEAAPLDAPSYGQPSFSQPSFAPTAAPEPQSPLKNPIVLAAAGGGALLFLGLIVLVVVMATRGDDKPKNPQIVLVDGVPMMVGANGETTPLVAKAAEPAEVKKPDAASAQAPAATATAAPGTATPTDGQAAAPAGAPPAVAAATGTPPADGAAADPPPAAPDDTKVASASKTDRRATPPRREEAKAPPKPPADKPAAGTGGKKCDPVLDFDCKAGGAAAAPKGDAKESLSKTDVLGVIKAGVPAIEACGKKNKVSGTLKMSWRVQTSGKTSDVQVADSKFAGTPVGTCATGVIKGWRFPAHRTAIPPVTFPFKLP